MLTWAGRELSSTLQTTQLDQQKNLQKHLNGFTVQYFFTCHNIKKNTHVRARARTHTHTHTHTRLLPDLQLKGCSSLLRCLPLNLVCFPF